MKFSGDPGHPGPSTRDEARLREIVSEEEDSGQASQSDRVPSNVNEHPRGHVGHTDEELREMRKYDLKRVKRIMANRSSAARSKVRKLRYTNELDSRIAALSNEQRNVQEEFYATQASIATISKENDLLNQEIQKLNDDVSRANAQSRQLKQHAHLLRMQVLAVPVLNMTSLPSYVAAQNDGLGPASLQLPHRPCAPTIPEPLASFTNNPRLPPFALGSQLERDSLHLPHMIAPTQPNPFATSQLWPNHLSTSSTSSAISSHTAGRLGGLGTEGQFSAEDPYLLNMLQSIEISDGPALASDVSSQSVMYNTGSSWASARPHQSHLSRLESRSSVGGQTPLASVTPADSAAWNLWLNRFGQQLPATGGTDPSSLLPMLREQSREQIQRRSAGDYPVGLQAPLEGLARFSRHFSTSDGPEAAHRRRGNSIGGPFGDRDTRH